MVRAKKSCFFLDQKKRNFLKEENDYFILCMTTAKDEVIATNTEVRVSFVSNIIEFNILSIKVGACLATEV